MLFSIAQPECGNISHLPSFRLISVIPACPESFKAHSLPFSVIPRKRSGNLSCDPEQVEGFPTSGNDTENKDTIF